MPSGQEAEAAILGLLDRRAEGLTICPSEAARQVAPAAWREAMPAVHEAARALVAGGQVVLMQSGIVTSPDDVVGAYRIRKV